MMFLQQMLRFVEDHQEPIFETIKELLKDKTIKFSMLAGQAPVLDRVKEELTKYWEGEANKGRSIEEFARFEEKDRVDIDFDYLRMVGCLYPPEQVNSCSTILFAGIRDTMSWQTLSSKRGK